MAKLTKKQVLELLDTTNTLYELYELRLSINKTEGGYYIIKHALNGDWSYTINFEKGYTLREVYTHINVIHSTLTDVINHRARNMRL